MTSLQGWNLFDLGLVSTALYEYWADLFNQGRMEGDLAWLRCLRVIKMLKTLRVVKVLRFFREMRTMLASMVGSIYTLFWSMLMLSLIMYIFGIMFLQGVA